MEHNPSWEPKSCSASRAITRILRKPKVHYRIHKCPSPVHNLSRINLVQAPSNFLELHFNITIPYTPRSSKWSLSLRFPHPNPVRISSVSHMCHMPRPSQPSWFDHPTNIWWGVRVIKLLFMQSCPFPCYPVFLSTLCSNTLSQRSSFNVRDQDSHPYKTTGKIPLVYLDLNIFGLQTGRQNFIIVRQNIQYWMIAGIPWLQSTCNSQLTKFTSLNSARKSTQQIKSVWQGVENFQISIKFYSTIWTLKTIFLFNDSQRPQQHSLTEGSQNTPACSSDKSS
jgi:hypothetical protein